MDNQEILTMGAKLDLLKARPAAAIGEEKIWSGVTYVKTPNGWKPKGKTKEPKIEEVSQTKSPEKEEPSVPKAKQIEDFAAKAKDSQLEAAVKDSKQEEEVKKIAQAELEKRKRELTESLDKKKEETENKTESKKEEPVKETSSIGEPGEERTGDISEEEIKEEIRKKAIEGSVDDKKAYMSDWYNKDVPYVKANKEELLKDLHSIELSGYEKSVFKETREQYKEYDLEKILRRSMNMISGDVTEAPRIKTNSLVIQELLIENNKEMICLPFMYQEYNGKEYNCYDYYGKEDEDFDYFENKDEGEFEDGWVSKHYQEGVPEFSKDEETALISYAGNSFYGFMTEYMFYKGDFSKISTEALNRASRAGYNSKEHAEEAAREIIKTLNSYVDKNPIQENVVLSRRINPTKNALIFDQITSLKKGDESSFESIQSFSYVQKAGFGNYQITLLAEKGDPIANAANTGEFEYISKQGAKFKVLETGFNSMVIKLIP